MGRTETVMAEGQAKLAEVLQRAMVERPPLPSTPQSRRGFKKDESSAQRNGSDDLCPRCRGIGFFIPDLPRSDPKFGRAVHCPLCFDFLASSRLMPDEQKITLRAMDVENPTHAVVQHVCQSLLADRRGWLCLHGLWGRGKSYPLMGLTADFCRAKVRAQYWTGPQVGDALYRDIGDDDGKEGGHYRLLRDVPALIVDELDGIHFDQRGWLAKRLASLLDDRYRNAARQVTIFGMNAEPEGWFCPDNGSDWATKGPAIWSRLRDGRFQHPWPEGMKRPGYLAQAPMIPSVLFVDGADLRPYLTWEDFA